MVVFAKNNRTEPLCLTCDIAIKIWSTRLYYENCSYFEAFVAPQSSIATDKGVDFFILECRGPSLPLAGEYDEE